MKRKKACKIGAPRCNKEVLTSFLHRFSPATNRVIAPVVHGIMRIFEVQLLVNTHAEIIFLHRPVTWR